VPEKSGSRADHPGRWGQAYGSAVRRTRSSLVAAGLRGRDAAQGVAEDTDAREVEAPAEQGVLLAQLCQLVEHESRVAGADFHAPAVEPRSIGLASGRVGAWPLPFRWDSAILSIAPHPANP